MTDIVLTCENQQRLILHLLETSHTHAHEVHSDFLVLEEFEVKKNGDQAFVHCQRDYEFPLEYCHTVFKEEHDHTCTDPSNAGSCASISLMDEYCRELSHWSCALVPCLGDHTISLDEEDSWMEKQHRNTLIQFYAIHPHMDWDMVDYMAHMETPYRKIPTHFMWKKIM